LATAALAKSKKLKTRLSVAVPLCCFRTTGATCLVTGRGTFRSCDACGRGLHAVSGIQSCGRALFDYLAACGVRDLWHLTAIDYRSARGDVCLDHAARPMAAWSESRPQPEGLPRPKIFPTLRAAVKAYLGREVGLAGSAPDADSA